SFRQGSPCSGAALVFFLTKSPMKDFTAPCLIFLFTGTPPQCADRASTALGCKSFGPRQIIHERLWQQIDYNISKAPSSLRFAGALQIGLASLAAARRRQPEISRSLLRPRQCSPARQVAWPRRLAR